MEILVFGSQLPLQGQPSRTLVSTVSSSPYSLTNPSPPPSLYLHRFYFCFYCTACTMVTTPTAPPRRSPRIAKTLRVTALPDKTPRPPLLGNDESPSSSAFGSTLAPLSPTFGMRGAPAPNQVNSTRPAASGATPPTIADASPSRPVLSPRNQQNQAPSGAVVDPPEGEVDEMVKVYTFLSSLRKDVLRKMGRVWGRRSTGNKSELIYRNFLFLKECKDNGREVARKMSTNIQCPDFEAFLKGQDTMGSAWKNPPPSM